MEKWQQAWWLAKFELKQSKLHILFLLLLCPLVILGFISNFNDYLSINFVGIDLVFLLLFTFAPIWAKPSHFQIQKINNGFSASPAIFMLQQLPITTHVIVSSRFIIYFIYTIPVQVITLIFLYAFTPALQEMMTIGPYIAFSIIWLSLGIYLGGIIPVGDAGDQSSTLKVAIYSILMLISLIAFFTFLHLVTGNGLVYWTLIFAQKWPILTALLSIIMAIFGLIFGQYYMRKTMGKLDYL